MMKRHALKYAALMGVLLSFLAVTGYAEDSEVTRQTLRGITGVQVVMEDLQPNLLKYEKSTKNFPMQKAQVLRDVEQQLKNAGIRILSPDEWKNAPGRPILYVNINTNESEKYKFAYNIRVELRQLVSLVANPQVLSLTGTWGMNITGVAHIGTLDLIRKDLGVLLDRFIQAHASVNRK
jgi:hypothetical protein